MSENIIEIQNVSRSFKRYRNQRYRVMDALGLSVPAGAYDTFWALRDVSVQVQRGERVALIGRNGAGKSTLLNLICGQLQPTSGSIKVKGRIQALMELGTGFHPEFTGKENIFAALAYQGVTGKQAQYSFDEIVDFSELHDFIHYPLKTYSAGMYARLAFATATAIVPDVLIIDEVLGAGDAYFASKSTERMRRLTVETGATVLFVSHDISSVERLCTRAIWLDRGTIQHEGPTLEISKLYYASIMEQEESRLRAETAKAVSRMRNLENHEIGSKNVELLFRFVDADQGSLRSDHPIGSIKLIGPDGLTLELHVGTHEDADQSQPTHLLDDPDYMSWGRREKFGARVGRSIKHEGGEYGHAPFKFEAPDYFLDAGSTLVVEHCAKEGDGIAVEIYENNSYRRLGQLQHIGSWTKDSFKVMSQVLDEEEEDNSSKWSTKEARFLKIEPVNIGTLDPQFVFGLREDFAFKIDIRASSQIPCFWLVVSIGNSNGERVIFNVEEFSEGIPSGETSILVKFANPNIRQGDYVVSFEMLAEFDYSWKKSGRFPHFAFWDRCVFFSVAEEYKGIIDIGRVKIDMKCHIL